MPSGRGKSYRSPRTLISRRCRSASYCASVSPYTSPYILCSHLICHHQLHQFFPFVNVSASSKLLEVVFPTSVDRKSVRLVSRLLLWVRRPDWVTSQCNDLGVMHSLLEATRVPPQEAAKRTCHKDLGWCSSTPPRIHLVHVFFFSLFPPGTDLH